MTSVLRYAADQHAAAERLPDFIKRSFEPGRALPKLADRARAEEWLVGETASAFEVGRQVALQALDDALGLRVGRLAEAPPDLQ